jgi:hypothetical protein
MLLRKASVLEEETKWAAWLYLQHNQSVHVTDGVTVTSLSAGLLQKISVVTGYLYQIRLNWKFLHKFRKWCKFSSCVKVKLCNKNVKQDLPVVLSILRVDVGTFISWEALSNEQGTKYFYLSREFVWIETLWRDQQNNFLRWKINITDIGIIAFLSQWWSNTYLLKA